MTSWILSGHNNESEPKISKNCKIYETILSSKHVVCNNSECNVLTVGMQSKAWICGLLLLELQATILLGSWMAISFQCCLMLGRDFCDGPISHPEESYRVCLCVCVCVCVSECDHETLTRKKSRSTRALEPWGKRVSRSHSPTSFWRHICANYLL